MQAYDFIILFLLVVTTIWGARRGFAKQVATLLSLALGYIVAVNFREPVAEMIEAPHPWNLFAAMLGLFMATSLVVWIGFRFVKGTIEESGMKGFDAQMGGLFGLAKGVVLAMVITMFAVVMLGETQQHAVLDSFSGYNMCRMINRAQSIVPTEWQEAMQPYMEVVEEHQQHIADGQELPFDTQSEQFEFGSPNDVSSSYDDPQFGNFPTEQPQPNQWNRFDEGTRQPQATLQQPLFETR